ncbi:TrbM/KikA/MpfK family conjugal transfer protein [Pseudomonas sp.]|uniref:TrbM/KikA/MpfK family conjugal transfer protein n=1 Tax=Pseudomonas sp. TaxID=306 RepID=UPI0035686E70
MKKKTLLFASTLTFAILAPSISVAGSPCGAELCLSDFKAATNVNQCNPEMDSFFKIVKKKHGKFSPSRTLKARRDYLYKCESGNTSDKERILAKFGAIVKPSY